MNWTCWNCKFKSGYNAFFDGTYTQGRTRYTVMRCPVCHHLQGRFEIGKHRTETDLYMELLSYMRQRRYLA